MTKEFRLSNSTALVADVGGTNVRFAMADLDAQVVPSFDTSAYRPAIDELSRLEIDPPRLREDARRWFDMRNGIARYDGIYRRLISRKTSTSRGAWEASE